MSSSLCPHLVQEYFERVSEILLVYRPQILKQVEYDKISENLVLRGAVRQEEHERIFRCRDAEGQVSQLLVVLQNRMWGLENLLAAFMEERVSTWLTQELFRAYMEHLVNPLKKLKDNPICQCAQISNSILYKGWVKALKSLDSLIIKTGNSLGFMRQNMYPTDNMLTFLSEKLAEFTGGDSSSTTSVQDELVPYGFAPNASGEVLVAELEEDDIDDLFSLGENLSIAYHSNDITKIDTKEQERATTDVEEFPARNGSGKAVITKPVERKVMNKRRSLSNTRPSSSDVSRERRSSDQESVSDKIQSAGNQEDPHSSNSEIQEKLAKQRELIARLSAPKTKTVKTSSSEVSSSVRRRHSPNSDDSKKLSSAKQRPKSEEYHRSTSSPSSSTSTAAATTSSSLHHEAKSSITSTISPSKPERNATTGKTHGFVRSKSHAPTSPKSRGRKLSPRSKPTAITKPNMKNFAKDGEAVEEEQWNDVDEANEDNCTTNSDDNTNNEKSLVEEEEDILERIALRDTKLFPDEAYNSEDNDLHEALPEMSSMLLSKTIFATGGNKAKNLDYYQLNFDDISDDGEA